mmetsp:Transcript_22890/g.52818  ORF Transcript_22890/g.52818 Transcript_22890/m.52818 type:complete len:323 (+) Transcript_22890:421-1389(+)
MLLPAEDVRLHRVGDNESDARRRLLLPDPADAPRRLPLDAWLQLRLEQDGCAGFRQCETSGTAAARARGAAKERDEKHARAAARRAKFETAQCLLLRGAAARERGGGDAVRAQRLVGDAEQARPARKDEQPLPLGAHAARLAQQRRHLGAELARRLRDIERRVTKRGGSGVGGSLGRWCADAVEVHPCHQLVAERALATLLCTTQHTVPAARVHARCDAPALDLRPILVADRAPPPFAPCSAAVFAVIACRGASRGRARATRGVLHGHRRRVRLLHVAEVAQLLAQPRRRTLHLRLRTLQHALALWRFPPPARPRCALRALL